MYISWKSSLLVLGLSAVFGSVNARAADRGTQVYKLCSYCHGEKGEGNPQIGAPAIAALPEWYVKRQLTNFRSGARGAHPKDLPGLRMYPMARTLKEGDIELVSKVVAGLPAVISAETVKGNPVAGKQKFAICATCHGPDGKGMEVQNAPTLIHASDWYLLKQLQNFKGQVRGSDPGRDPTGAMMAPMAATLSDQDMLDIVAYINTLNYPKK